jgi:hypothetical protein
MFGWLRSEHLVATYATFIGEGEDRVPGSHVTTDLSALSSAPILGIAPASTAGRPGAGHRGVMRIDPASDQRHRATSVPEESP